MNAESIGSWIARRALMTPNRTAIVAGGSGASSIGPRSESRRVSYAELNENANRVASALAARGVGPGDRVAMITGNAVEPVEIFFGCAKLGAVVVPLSWRLAAPEVEFMLNDSGSRVLIYESEIADTVKSLSAGVQTVLAIGESDAPSYAAAISNADPAAPTSEPDTGDALAIFYTSGTTGRPKGAVLTHGNFFWTNLNMLLALDLSQTERSLVVLPLFHVGGWNVNSLSVWWKGGTVYMPRAFDAPETLRTIERESITSFMGVPTIYQMLADDPAFTTTDLSSLRTLICGGAPLPESLIRRYLERGLQLIQGYGLTEAAPNCLMLPSEHALDKLGSAGRPYFFTQVEVFGEGDRPVARPGAGEVVVRGPSVMKGYWLRPEETAQALRGGWLRTGDVGRIDEDGFIWIVDRTKDMFISGGENVYPAEIENVLASHPKVLEAAVIGVPDERWGEAGRAIVVAREEVSADEISSFLRDRLAKFKVPRDIVFAEEIPRNATGKILKAELREKYA